MTENEQISEKMVGEVLVVILSGQYTGGEEFDAFQDSLQRAVSKGIQRVVVDLGRVTYTNSSFVGGLLAAHTSLSRKGGEIFLCDVPEALLKILQVTRLDNVFEMYASVDEALIKKEK
ncbi:MAG: STAS domain-containing protein [Candidatus Kapabacteria bacterium]|nr:STAS domain-containing protein [Candidatus Kapabacteria bacterium]